METVKTTSCKTNTCGTPKKIEVANGSLSFVSTVLLILVPKCPLCMTAYMSAAVLFFDVEYTTLTPILLHTKPVMGLLIMVLILRNRKDVRTWVSLGIASTAMVFLVLRTYFFLTHFIPEWILYSAFVFAIWYNGNFRYFYRFVRFRLTQKLLKTQ